MSTFEQLAPAVGPPQVGLPQRILAAVEQVIVGQHAPIEVILAALLSGGHVLLEDKPGVGKTILARTIAATLGLEMNRIQGTPDLLPTDVTGIHVFNPADGTWPFRAGPIFSNIVLVDEFNRATPKAQSALLEAMAERQVTVDGVTTALPAPFMVIATQNPMGEAGTYPLVSAQLDRFAVMCRLGLPDLESERQVVAGQAGADRLAAVEPVAAHQEIARLIANTKNVRMSDSMVDYLLLVVSAIRDIDDEIWLSVRVSETIAQVARGHAVVKGREYVAPEDIQAVTPAVLIHRLPRQFDEDVIADIVRSMPVPVSGD